MSHRILLLVAAAGVLTACERGVDATSPMRAPQSASFDQPLFKTNTVTTTSETVTNPCNGDVVTLTGNAHIVLTESADGTTLHVNFSDLTGVGAPSGLQYHQNGTSDQTLRLDGSALVIETLTNQELISQGAADNFIVHSTQEVSFATFPPTMTTKRATAECEG